MRFTKKLLMAALVTVMVFIAMPGNALANDAIRITIDEEVVQFEGQGPVIVDGSTLVPVRGVFETMGFTVGWDGDTRTATLSRTGYVVNITIDSAVFTTNGVSHTLEVPAQIIGGSTMLPIRAVLESVGYSLDWDGATRTVLITSGSTTAPIAEQETTVTAPTAMPDDSFIQHARSIGWQPVEFEGIRFYHPSGFAIERLTRADGRTAIRQVFGASNNAASVVVSPPISISPDDYAEANFEMFERTIRDVHNIRDEAFAESEGPEAGVLGRSFVAAFENVTTQSYDIIVSIYYNNYLINISGRFPISPQLTSERLMDFYDQVMLMAQTIRFI